MIVTNRETGLRPGDSRYPYKCDKCYRVVDTVQRKHTSVEQGKARAPDNLRPGEKFLVDGGDATVSRCSVKTRKRPSNFIFTRSALVAM